MKGIAMQRSCAFLLTVVSIFVSAFSQTSGIPPSQSNCSIAEAPAIRGIKLGMTANEILALLPEGNENQINKRAVAEAERPPHHGVAHLSFQHALYPPSVIDRFAGIESAHITLFDGHVVDVRVSYSGPSSYPRGPAWESIDAFVTKLSESLGLPESKYWVYQYSGSNSKVVKCPAFEIEAATLNRQGSIRIHSNGDEEKARQRAAAEEERLRREFKP
jgi:hypothetical protein